MPLHQHFHLNAQHLKQMVVYFIVLQIQHLQAVHIHLGWCVFLFLRVMAVNAVQKEYSGQSVTSGQLYKAQYGKLNICCSGSNNFFASNFVKFETIIS